MNQFKFAADLILILIVNKNLICALVQKEIESDSDDESTINNYIRTNAA